MIFLGLIIFLLLILALGYLTLLFWPDSDREPQLILAFALGGGLITWQLLIAKFVCKLLLGTWCLGLFALEIVALAILHWRRSVKILPAFQLPKFSNKLNLALLSVLAVVLVLALIRAITNPLLVFDALAVWAYRVKILYYHQADLLNPDSLVFWSGLSKSNYPWHLSLLAWLQAFLTGGVSNTLINFLPWCYYAGLVATVYSLAKSRLTQTWSLFLALLVATMPLLFYHSYSFYADLPLAFYLAVTCLVWRRWLVTQATSTFLLTTVLAGLALLVKSEAIFFVAPLVCLSIFKIWQEKALLKNVWPLLLTVAVYGPWVLWLLIYRLGVSNVASGLAWHPQVTTYIFSALFSAASWHIWWYLVALLLALTCTKVIKQSVFRYCALWFVLAFACFLGLYYFTETYQYALDNTAFSRNMLLFIVPSAALLVDSLAAWLTD